MNIVKLTGLILSGILLLACHSIDPAPSRTATPARAASTARTAEPAGAASTARTDKPEKTASTAGTAEPEKTEEAAAAASSKRADELDAAIREASDYLNRQLPAGNKLAILNVQSDFPALSEYIIDELIANTVNDRVFSVVDRQQLNTIRAELDFQTSGEVSDESAQSIGQILGAQIIVSGAVSKIGELYRLRVRALSVQTAAIEGQFNRNIPEGPTVAALVKSRATGYGGAERAPPAPVTPAQANTTPPAPAPALTPVPASSDSGPSTASAPPAPANDHSRPGLYADGEYKGDMDLYDALDWLTLNARGGGNYTFALGRDHAITPTELTYNSKQLTLTLKSSGGKHKISFDGASPSYSLFTVGSGVTLALEEGVTLTGTQNRADKSLVRVAGGRFLMNGGTISGNRTSGYGGGVHVASGSFTMNNGTISGNTAGGRGGGVYAASGAFTMNNGTISGNTAGGSGGGVYAESGAFTMSGGTISGNTASYSGGGVYANTFSMSGGAISGNTASGGNNGGGVYAGTFTMSGGAISGNTAYYGGGVRANTFTMTGGAISANTASYGGGVYADTFTKPGGGGVIYGSNAPGEQANRASDDSVGHAVYAYNKKRNTTARAATAMDSKKDGPSGGWE